MRARGALVNQLRMIAQERSKRRDIAGDDRLRCCLEPHHARILPVQRVDVLEQLRPALDVVHPRDDELRVGEHELAGLNLRIGESAKARMVPADAVEGLGIAGLERLDEVLRLLSRLLEVDARGKRLDGHDDPLSWKRLESARIRLKEGSCVVETNGGWARPFPRTGGAPRAHREHTPDPLSSQPALAYAAKGSGGV